jgi:hypothetical protein
MGLNNTTRADIYKCFISDLSTEECASKLKISYPKARRYYTEFIVASIRIKDSATDRIAQAIAIEAELFRAIKRNPNSQLTIELQNTYCKYLVK